MSKGHQQRRIARSIKKQQTRQERVAKQAHLRAAKRRKTRRVDDGDPGYVSPFDATIDRVLARVEPT